MNLEKYIGKHVLATVHIGSFLHIAHGTLESVRGDQATFLNAAYQIFGNTMQSTTFFPTKENPPKVYQSPSLDLLVSDLVGIMEVPKDFK